jgi:HD-GYP domain-containing protein (c-di-GMP phosphodiesterase class II)
MSRNRILIVDDRPAEQEMIKDIVDHWGCETAAAGSGCILNMSDGLATEEWGMVKLHPVIGDGLISPLRFLSEARFIERHRYERLDCSGYPDGLSGRQITNGIRAVSMCDTYDAMTSPRPWRLVLSKEETTARLLEGKGVKFDT